MASTPQKHRFNLTKTWLWSHKNNVWMPWEQCLDAMNRLCTHVAGRVWIVHHCRFVAGRGPCGRPQPLYVIIVVSGYVYECLRVRTATRAAPCKTSGAAFGNRKLTSEIGIESYIREEDSYPTHGKYLLRLTFLTIWVRKWPSSQHFWFLFDAFSLFYYFFITFAGNI